MPDGTLARGLKPAHPHHDHALQARLAAWNRHRLAMQTPPDDWREKLDAEHAMRLEEIAFIEITRAEQAARAAQAPRKPGAFVDWFEALKQDGPGQGDALFSWIAERATLDEMKWFVEQEAAGEAGFDDMVAMAQVKAPTQAKLELARNYWDEMGRGNAKGMHGPMLDALVIALKVKPQIETTLAPSLALGNTMAALATNRAYAYHALGALGVIELTAPGRAAKVSEALRRLKVSAKARHYFDLHAVLDVKHSEAWNREVFHSLVAERPDAAPFIAEGALMRLQCGADCFDAYRRHFWGGEGQARARLSERATALADLLQALRVRDYNFITPTPTTHTRVLARPEKQVARDLRDVFGWSLPFSPDVVGEPILRMLRDAEMLEQRGEYLRSLVRISSLGADLFLHSAFPTTLSDAVFFGPDSYRFVRFLEEVLPLLPRNAHLVDIGAGTGVGGLAAATLLPDTRITLTDINPAALELAAINWAHSRLPTPHILRGDTLKAVTDEIDIVIANPPYIADAAHRTYRDGGGMHGGALSVRWADDAARRLPSGGALALYTGTAIINGEDPLREALTDLLGDFDVRYEEIDPDVFGEELERADYADVDRIAVVGVVAVKR